MGTGSRILGAALDHTLAIIASARRLLFAATMSTSGPTIPSAHQTENGRRPVFSGREDPEPSWQDALFFHEYFHGDEGTGLGASHQTGRPGSAPIW